jgi:hypothetical protein
VGILLYYTLKNIAHLLPKAVGQSHMEYEKIAMRKMEANSYGSTTCSRYSSAL